MTAAAATRRDLEAALSVAAASPDPHPALVAALASTRPDLASGGRLTLDTVPAARPLFDAALRSVLAAALASAADAGEPIATHAPPSGDAPPTVPALLALATAAAGAGEVEAATPLAALEDAVEAAPAAQAGDAAALIETVGAAVLALPTAGGWDRCKLPLLRVCNGLLARLPRRGDAGGPAAAARVHLFLARAAPPSDKSGLNLLGAANEGHPVAVGEVGEGEPDADGRPVDAAVYDAFWSLAPSLQAPLDRLPPDAWPAFAARVRTVLTAFKATTVAVAAGSAAAAAAPTAPADAAAALPPVGPFYLASPALFGLQLRDGTARRHFLVSALVAVHAARHPPPRLADRRGVLRSKALADAAALEADLYAALAATPAQGAAFAAAVRAALCRETAWAAWKAGAPPCAPLDREAAAPPTVAPVTAPAPPAKRAKGGLGAPGPPVLGTPDLDRLWAVTPDNAVPDLRSEDRGVVPSLRDFLRPVALEMDPEEGIEPPYKKQAGAVYQWKALRQLARADMAAFTAALAAGRDLEVAVARLYPADVPDGWAPPPPPPVEEKEKEGKGSKRKAGSEAGAAGEKEAGGKEEGGTEEGGKEEGGKEAGGEATEAAAAAGEEAAAAAPAGDDQLDTVAAGVADDGAAEEEAAEAPADAGGDGDGDDGAADGE